MSEQTKEENKALLAPQVAQDDFYEFPYHYVAQFRGRFSQTFYDAWGINYVSTIELILGLLHESAFEKIVDVGCGDGRLVDELSREFPGKIVRGIDYSRRAIALAKAMRPDRQFAICDVCHEPVVEDNDGAIVMEVYEHIHPDNAARFIKGVARLLKPGGFVIVTVPHQNKPLEAHHFRHFDGAGLKREWNECFEVLKIAPFERRSPVRTLLAALMRNRFFILNHGRMLNALYTMYKKHLLLSDSEERCQRLLLTGRLR